MRRLLVGLAMVLGMLAAPTPDLAEAASSPQLQELRANDGAASDEFGSSAAVSGNGQVALVSAIRKSGFQGAAYVFVRQANG